MAPTRNYPMCKNSTWYHRTRNFGAHDHAETEKTQKFVFRSALRPNQISFSHSQDPTGTFKRKNATATQAGSVSRDARNQLERPRRMTIRCGSLL